MISYRQIPIFRFTTGQGLSHLLNDICLLVARDRGVAYGFFLELDRHSGQDFSVGRRAKSREADAPNGVKQ